MGGKPHIYVVFKIYCGVGCCVIFVKLRDTKSSVYKDHCQQLGHGFPSNFEDTSCTQAFVPGSAVLTIHLMLNSQLIFLSWIQHAVDVLGGRLLNVFGAACQVQMPR